MSLKYFLLCILTCFGLSCNKFLDEKALKQQFIPTTIEDLQALLNDMAIVQRDPVLLEVLSDEYYVSPPFWDRLTSDLSLNYIWAPNAVPHNASWNLPYMEPIYKSNIVLDKLSESVLPIDEKYANLKGRALFYRSNAFFNIAQVFCSPYSETNLLQSGIVLRLTSDINIKSTRSSLKETYDRIVSDLNAAADLLPASTIVLSQPSRYAAYAALARVYLAMAKYDSAYKYADLCLSNKNELMDYNDLIPGQPIGSFNKEVIFYSTALTIGLLLPNNARIDSVLIGIYDENDLRKQIFFRQNLPPNNTTYSFWGSYNGTENTSSVFTGTTSSEMYLIRAESNARLGRTSDAVNDLNALLEKRWRSDDWTPLDPSLVTDALLLVLEERRKELVYRGLRWMDLKRYNRDGANITLKRIVNNIEYTLPPNDNRWLPLIPYEVIIRAGIAQNPR